MKGADAGNGIRVFVPDIGMFIASLTIWLVCRKVVQKPVTEDAAQYNMQFENEEMVLNTHVYLTYTFLASTKLGVCLSFVWKPFPKNWLCSSELGFTNKMNYLKEKSAL